MDKCSLKLKESNKKFRKLIRTSAETSSVCDSPTTIARTPILSPIAITPSSSSTNFSPFSPINSPTPIAKTMGGGITTPQNLVPETYQGTYVSPILTSCGTCPPQSSSSIIINSSTTPTTPITASTINETIGLKTTAPIDVSVYDTGGSGSSGNITGEIFTNHPSPSVKNVSEIIKNPHKMNNIEKFTFKSSDHDYHQYTIASPNNPFLPEIIAKGYSIDLPHANEIATSSPPPLLSSLHCSDSIGSPTSELLQQVNFSPVLTTKSSNPFLSSNCTSPQFDLSTKREEFLKATMKICLVVSPPTNKLQLKSKSLTDLDILDSITCQQGTKIESEKQQVSSSEYFSVSFCIDSDRQEEELIPAIKGLSLFDALSPSLKKRNLSFAQIAICDNSFQSYNDSTNSPPYTSSLDESTDVENLSGKHLIVVDRDSSKRTGQLQKAASFGARTRPPRLLSSASTEETTESEQKIIPGKQLKQRWSGLFGMKNQQQSHLCELLNDYAKKGVPQKISSLNFNQAELQNALDYLGNMHKSWRDFVQSQDMTDGDIKVQSAIWELVTTEVDYIHALKTVTDLFLACLEGIQEKSLLTDVDQNKLFSNIYDIYEANFQFWSHYLYPMVEKSIATSSPMSIDFFQEGFINFALTFAPYKKYCAEQSTCQFYCKELNRNNPLFTSYLAWCESQKMCNRLRLADILVRPMQRLTKYSLLLTAIRKHICDENNGDNMDAMIHSVENFVCSVNTHLTTRQENERLKGIMARIESYDVVDSNNEHLDKFTKQYSNMFDLCSPMKGCPSGAQGRHLFMEGDLKFKDSIGKSDVHCFLLTDILLICKTIAKKGQGTLKVIRQPYMTDRLAIKQKDNILYCVYLNEFQMAVTAFTLQCNEAKSWHDAMTKAKHIYSRLKQGSNWDGYNLRYTNSGSINNADTLSIKKSPLNSSIGSRVSSLNNSHSGSVELNDSRNISIDFEKTNSLSSDEGSFMSCNQPVATKPKTLVASPQKMKTSSSNQLAVQPHNNLGQSLPNLNLHPSQTSNLYHTYSNNTLLVPGSSHSGYLLLSPSHRGISYPPPSPTRATLRRGFAFSSSIKNPPLVKTRNITSQNSFNLPTLGAISAITSPQTQSIATQQILTGSIQNEQQLQQQQQQPLQTSSNSLQSSNESNV